MLQVTQLHEEAEWDDLRNEFKSLLNETLQYTSLVARQYNLNSQTNFAKFWRALLNQVSSILEKVINFQILKIIQIWPNEGQLFSNIAD